MSNYEIKSEPMAKSIGGAWVVYRKAQEGQPFESQAIAYFPEVANLPGRAFTHAVEFVKAAEKLDRKREKAAK